MNAQETKALFQGVRGTTLIGMSIPAHLFVLEGETPEFFMRRFHLSAALFDGYCPDYSCRRNCRIYLLL